MNLEQEIDKCVAVARTETLYSQSHRETGAIIERLAHQVALVVMSWRIEELKEVAHAELP